MNYNDKNILIISHNPLSRVNNNGKTLASIFDGVPYENIYQIYLNTDIPDFSKESHYLQINERQILISIINLKNKCCQEVEATPNDVSSAKIKKRNFANHTKRLLRECICKISLWKSELSEWLKDKHFDVVFFMAGDGMFAYDVYRFVMKNIKVKGCLFFTDDYIIGKTSFSPVALLRQLLLKRKMKATLKITNELYVISEEMKQAYEKIFDISGYVIRNFSVERSNEISFQSRKSEDSIVMVYAGGLHYNRWKVLVQIANELKSINQVNKVKCQMKIYSSQNISENITDQMNVEGVSFFMGGASASEISSIYADADILLHVESFEKKAIASTKYSFSTKIPEYLSAGKCIFAVGPSEVASLRYLSDFACTVSESEALPSVLEKLINDNDYRELIRSNCEKQYETDFSRKKQEDCLRRIVSV